MIKPFAHVLLGFLILASTSCQTAKIVCRPASPPLPSFHAGEDGIPIRRVVVLPPYYDRQATAGPVRDLSLVLNSELAKTSLFEIISISPAEMEAHFGQSQFSSAEALPVDMLARLRAEYAADGVLFTDVTHYFPYHPIAIGLRMKLADTATGRIHWAFDHVFDSSQPATSEAAQRFYVKNSPDHYPVPQDGSPILQSPARFSRFVAFEVFRSLQNVPRTQDLPKVAEKSAD